MTTKPCNRCHEPKPIKQFSKYAQSKDGLSYYCKVCVSLQNKNDYNNAKRNGPVWFIMD